MHQKTVRHLYIYILSFFAGMCIMAIELSASRLMAPYFGTSTFIWTNIIGVIMIALAAGYMIGGKMADKKPQLEVLLSAILIACVILFLVPFLTPAIIGAINNGLLGMQSASTMIFAGSLLAICTLFFVPIMLLGMTSPFLIKLISHEDTVGASAGRIFGISTIGSIVGTFLPTLVFIPNFGTAKTILIFTGVLFLVAVIGFFKTWVYLLLIICVFPWVSPYSLSASGDGLIFETESAYQYIRLYDRGTYRMLVYDLDVGAQSVENKADIMTKYYFDYYSLLPLFQEGETENVLLIGSAGGVIAKQIGYFFPEVLIEGVEIDKKVIEISREYFDLPESVPVYNQDGRIFLDQSDKKYDLIIVDAYSNQLYIPFHLATREFFQSARGHLTPQGIVAMNINAAQEDSPLLASISNTLDDVFANVYYFHIEGNSFNYVVIASDNELDFGMLIDNAPEKMKHLAVHAYNNVTQNTYDPHALVLTDDKAPVEHMTDREILEYIFEHKK